MMSLLRLVEAWEVLRWVETGWWKHSGGMLSLGSILLFFAIAARYVRVLRRVCGVGSVFEAMRKANQDGISAALYG